MTIYMVFDNDNDNDKVYSYFRPSRPIIHNIYIQNKMTSVKHTTISCYSSVIFKKTVNSDFSLLELLYPHLYVQMHRKCILTSLILILFAHETGYKTFLVTYLY